MIPSQASWLLALSEEIYDKSKSSRHEGHAMVKSLGDDICVYTLVNVIL